eukprot:Nk52_evm35s2209 gene=Nk52_evmTU35s2209
MMTNKTATAAAAPDVQPPTEGAKLWGGRFSSATDPVMESFNASIGYDKKMAQEDIMGSIAYAKAISLKKLLSEAELKAIVEGLQVVAEEWAQGKFTVVDADEDIHTANERRLTELIGIGVAGKLHTGRSRNDQVTVDMRLWLREEIKRIMTLLLRVISIHVARAQDEIDLLFPGYTHLQRAQTIRWSHWLMSYCAAWKRDFVKLEQTFDTVNVLTLGCGALAGNAFGVDRKFLKDSLQFNSVSDNSLDSTGDRDFIVDFMYASTMMMSHFSKWSEDLINYSSKEFSFVKLSDAYSTGSSLMPQKKNPDSLELIRGKSGRVFGHMSGMLMSMKGLPSTYNKDLQEDKEHMFDVADTMRGVLQIAGGVMSSLTFDQKMAKQALSTDLLATDLAYYLVRKGVPFRNAHCFVGSVVREAEECKVDIMDVPLDALQSICPSFEEDVKSIWDFEKSVEQYSSSGGTSKSSVLEQIANMKEWIGTKEKKWFIQK